MGDISGLGNLKGSQKAYDLYSKTQYIHKQNKKLYFLTGTPISNSITELYALQSRSNRQSTHLTTGSIK